MVLGQAIFWYDAIINFWSHHSGLEKKMADSKRTERVVRSRKKLELREDEVEKLNADVRERLIFVINNFYVYSGRYAFLEDRYGISARKWKNVCNRVQLPGINMLTSILNDFPHFAMWLMLGKTVNAKQIDPTGGVLDCKDIMSAVQLADIIGFVGANQATEENITWRSPPLPPRLTNP